METIAMYGLIGSLKATPGKRAELVSILLANVGALPGCSCYVVAEDTADPDTLWITEVWDTQASHKASLELSVVKGDDHQGHANHWHVRQTSRVEGGRRPRLGDHCLALE